MPLKQYPSSWTRRNYSQWEDVKNAPYDYENKGLIKHIMSKTIVNSKNPLLQMMLRFYESSLVWVMKYADVLRHFKDIHWRNR